MLARLYRNFDRLGEIFAFAGMICLSAIVAVSMFDIVGRKWFKTPIIGMEDITSLAMMACIALSMPITFLREGHVGVEFVTDGLRPRALAGLKCAIAVLTLIFVFYLTWYGWKQALNRIGNGDISDTLAIPIFYFWTPLIVGLIASVFASLLLVVRFGLVCAGGPDFAKRAVQPGQAGI